MKPTLINPQAGFNKRLTTDIFVVSATFHKEIMDSAFRIANKTACLIHKNNHSNPRFLSIDFAYAQNNHIKEVPQLIEIQSFPSVIGASLISDLSLPIELSCGHDVGGRIAIFKDLFIDNEGGLPVLLEWQPWGQVTQFDFLATSHLIPNLKIVDISTLQIKHKGGRVIFKTPDDEFAVGKIYNRALPYDIPPEFRGIFKTLIGMVPSKHWINHPDESYTLNKSAMADISDEAIPETYNADDPKIRFTTMNGVLKPVFGHSGANVILRPSATDWQRILRTSDEPYIWQSQIDFKPVTHNQKEYSTEIRVMMCWVEGQWEVLSTLVRAHESGLIGNQRFPSLLTGTLAFNS